MNNFKYIILIICILFSSEIEAQEFKFIITSPFEIKGEYKLYNSNFGPKDTFGIFEKEIVLSSPINPCGGIINDVSNKIVFVDRGACSSPNESDGNFISKVRHAQSSNAIAVIICNNDNPAVGPGLPAGDIDNIQIKSFLMEKTDCEKIKLSISNNTVIGGFQHKLCVQPDTSENIIWGSKVGEGDFAYGLNDWTINRYEKDSIKWWPSGRINNDITFNSYSACNGIAIIYGSEQLCNNCGKNSLISPQINVKNKSKLGLNIEFQYLSTNNFGLTNTRYYLYISKDDGISWIDSLEIKGEGLQSYQFPKLRDLDSIRIKFEGRAYNVSSGTFWWAFDDVVVKSITEVSCNTSLWVGAQSNINQFIENNPGCTELNSLTIELGFFSDTVDFTFLNQIKTINGNLTLRTYNTSIIDLLPNLEKIGGNLVLTNNYNVKYIRGFNNLKLIKGNFQVNLNNEIDFPSFNNLDSIHGAVLITDNTNVNNINNITNLKFIGTRYNLSDNTFLNESNLNLAIQSINGRIDIRNNNNLKTIEGFNVNNGINFININLNNDLLEINGFNNFNGALHTIDIIGNNKLEQCNILNEAKSIFRVRISNNTSFKFLNGFNRCDSVEYISVKDNNDNLKINNVFNELINATNIEFNNVSNFNFSFEKLKSVGSLKILKCSKLEQISNFNAIKTTDNLTISECPNLIQITGLKSIEEGNIEISKNIRLHSLNDFNNLLDGSLNIYNNSSLLGIEGFHKLKSADILIKNNIFLNKIPNFKELKSSQGILIEKNHSLEYISGFDSLVLLGNGKLKIIDNSSLIAIKGFNQLNKINELPSGIDIDINIDANPNLKEIEGFNKIERISGILIRNNKNLDSINIFRNLKYIEDVLYLIDNPNLTHIQGFDKVDTINYQVGIVNLGVKDIAFLESVKYISYGLAIQKNTNLESLEHLINLKRIGQINNKGIFEVYLNPNLKSLKGLDNINSSSIKNLAIVDNFSLDYCQVKSVCLFLDDHSQDAIIAGNDFNCGSIVRVKDACSKLTGLQDPSENSFIIYPNPAFDEITIDISIPVEVTLTDIYGRVVLKQLINIENKRINVSGLQQGLYFITFGKNAVVRLIKL